MKARAKELLERAISATVAAIEIYNKPNFLYREETFAVLAINGWELLLKAKWLADNGNKIRSLYVLEERRKLDGTKSKKLKIKLTRSGNPFTHGLDYLAKKLVDSGTLDQNALANLQALTEIRDCSVHFYHRSENLSLQLQEIGAASLKNFVAAAKSWFDRDLSEFNFYLLPLSFVSLPKSNEGLVLNQEESNFLTFIDGLRKTHDNDDSDYSVTINIDIKFTRSKIKEAVGVQITNNPDAPEVRITEEQISEKYPWDYTRLTSECRKRYTDFKLSQKYHDLRKSLLDDRRFGHVRFLDANNPKSAKKSFFNPNIISELDKHFTKIQFRDSDSKCNPL